MFALRLLLNLTLVVALAVVCPIRCQAGSVCASGSEASVEPASCPCCPGESNETPDAPDDCCGGDCVCDGAVGGPRVTTVDLPPAIPGDLPAVADELTRLTACSLGTLDERPDAPDGATLRLLLASLVI